MAEFDLAQLRDWQKTDLSPETWVRRARTATYVLVKALQGWLLLGAPQWWEVGEPFDPSGLGQQTIAVEPVALAVEEANRLIAQMQAESGSPLPQWTFLVVETVTRSLTVGAESFSEALAAVATRAMESAPSPQERALKLTLTEHPEEMAPRRI